MVLLTMAGEMRKCSKCGAVCPLEQYKLKDKRNGRREFWCPVCRSVYQKRWYRNHPEGHKASVLAYNKARTLEWQGRIQDYLRTHPCVDCGESDPVVLEFDHVRGEKADRISRMVCDLRRWDVIEQEITKCDIRCANCHRRRTAYDLGWKKGLRIVKTGS